MTRQERLKGIRLLLIDDDPLILDSLTLFFQDEGCHVDAEETAEGGLESLTKRTYDIIICDYCLPGMNGMEFFKKVTKSHPDVVKILTTAFISSDVLPKTPVPKIHSFIPKPFTAEDILSALLFSLNRRDGFSIHS